MAAKDIRFETLKDVQEFVHEHLHHSRGLPKGVCLMIKVGHIAFQRIEHETYSLMGSHYMDRRNKIEISSNPSIELSYMGLTVYIIAEVPKERITRRDY